MQQPVQCNDVICVCPHQVLAELKKSNFTLLNHTIQFDANGNPKFGSFSVVYWSPSGEVEDIGFYKFQPSVHFFINDTKIQWFTSGEVSFTRWMKSTFYKVDLYVLVHRAGCQHFAKVDKFPRHTCLNTCSPQLRCLWQRCLFPDLLRCLTLVQVPTSLCSRECLPGHARKQDGIHECCFTCEVCLNGTYVNATGKLWHVKDGT